MHEGDEDHIHLDEGDVMGSALTLPAAHQVAGSSPLGYPSEPRFYQRFPEMPPSLCAYLRRIVEDGNGGGVETGWR